MFKVGDVVICNRPGLYTLPERLHQVAIVTGFRRGSLILSAPFWTESQYSSDQFDLYNPTLENK